MNIWGFNFGKNTDKDTEVSDEHESAAVPDRVVLEEAGIELEFAPIEDVCPQELPVEEQLPIDSCDEADKADLEEIAPLPVGMVETEGEKTPTGVCCGGDACGQLEKKLEGMCEAMCQLQALVGTIYQNQQQLVMSQDDMGRNLQMLQGRVENVLESQELTIQKQHNAALKYQDDVIYKIQKNLIMELIGISDNIRMILQNSESDPGYDLLGAVKDLGAWVDASLSNNSVRKFQDTTMDPSTMNRKRQQLVDKEQTSVEAEHNTYRTVSPGYEWSMPYLVVNSDVQLKKILEENAVPQMFSYVIRPEEIVKLEYCENNKAE